MVNWEKVQTYSLAIASTLNTCWSLVKVGLRDKISVDNTAVADIVFAALISIMFFIGLGLRSTLKSVAEILPSDLERRFSKMLDLQTELLARTTLICESVLDIPSHHAADSVCEEQGINVDHCPDSDASRRNFTVGGKQYELRSNLFKH